MKFKQEDRDVIFAAERWLIEERRRVKRERRAARVIARTEQRELWRSRSGYAKGRTGRDHGSLRVA